MRLRMLALSLLAAAACSTPESRIKKHRAVFDASAPDVQRKIREGQVDVGFTREQAAIALGRPDRIYTRKTAQTVQEVWAYGVVRPSVGAGVGFMSGGPGYGGVGFGSGVGIDDYAGEERTRVVFQDGTVVSVESR